jgi:hypothetical protein
MFRLDEDLSRFYELVREDDLAWCALGAGRMLRAPTVFEDVVKTNSTQIRKRLKRGDARRRALLSGIAVFRASRKCTRQGAAQSACRSPWSQSLGFAPP